MKYTYVIHKIKPIISQYRVILTSLAGSLVVSAWTLLRHMSGQANFDVIGQIGIVAQWQHGIHDGSLIGTTHYVLKMPLYAFINSLPIAPFHKPFVAALVVNIITFLLLYIVLRKFAQLVKRGNTWWPEIAALWFSVIAGRVLWVNYANSRNLELAGALWFIYLVFNTLQHGLTRGRVVALSLLGTALYFSDPLSLYITLPPLVTYCLVIALRHSKHRALTTKTIVILLTTAGAAILLRLLTPHMLPVQFLTAPQTQAQLNTTTLENTALGILRLFDANLSFSGSPITTIRQLCAALLVCAALFIIVKSKHTRYTWVLTSIVGWSVVLYIASGNALITSTERYLVFVPLLVFTSLAMSRINIKTALTMLVLITVLASSVVLGVAQARPTRYSGNAPMLRVAALSSIYPTIATSRELAIPANYYAGYSRNILPLGCEKGLVALSNVFYDKARFVTVTTQPIWLVLPEEGVRTGGDICTKAMVSAQLRLGKPVENIAGLGEVYLLSAQDARTLQR